ncbi:hypothetical protein Pcinc_032999 [Petrolisthes cinctipes]|uniref:Uncharacterized protein n=1 Tax=Petrolisthes cinctipes TaxID=88211 RepID=A0AAE1ETA6_PETCI|nr:hypothetical protein Pcinc_032999 [Petrolisthes cinctipes]
MTSPSASRFLLLPHLLASLITEFFISLSSGRLPHWCHYLSSTISFLLPLPRLPHHHISLPLPSPDSSYLSHHTTFSPSLLMSPSSASLITHHHFSLAASIPLSLTPPLPPPPRHLPSILYHPSPHHPSHLPPPPRHLIPLPSTSASHPSTLPPPPRHLPLLSTILLLYPLHLSSLLPLHLSIAPLSSTIPPLTISPLPSLSSALPFLPPPRHSPVPRPFSVHHPVTPPASHHS